MKTTYKKEIKVIIRLAIPVIIAQLAQTGITFVDTIMAGHYSKTALSGVALASSIWLPTILFGQGLLSVLTPIIANLNGAAKRDQIAAHTKQGFVVATILSVFIMIFLYNSDKVIALSGKEIDPNMLYVAKHFLHSIMWGAPAFLYFLVFRNHCEGLGNTKPAMVIMFMALIANIPINYILIYGKLGLPAFGGVGCGITAAILFWLMFIMILSFVYFTPSQKDIRQSKATPLFNMEIIKRIVIFGTPLAFAYFFEITLFSIISLMIAPLGETVVASNQIILTLSSMTFAIPLSIGIATSIRVGYLLGNKQPKQAKQTAYISLTIAFCSAIIVALSLVLFRRFFILWFSTDETIIAIGMQLILLLALYQLSDYLQVTAANVLRGYKDTKSILYITFTSYWVIGFPLGYVLGLTDYITTRMGAAGFWIGIIVGLLIAAILLISRMIYIQKQPIEVILKQAGR
ncbi:MATE family efflux transporter [Orbaceae bacterium ac157xtp]